MHDKKRLILTLALLMPLNQALWAEQVDGGAEVLGSDEVAPVTQDESSIQMTESETVEERVDAAVPSGVAGAAEAAEVKDTAPESVAATDTVEGTETAEPAEVVEEVETAESTEPEITEESSSETQTKLPSASSTSGGSARDHWKAREEQYQALRKRAEEAGVMLPERPPWYSEMGQKMRPNLEERMAHRNAMMSMSSDERDAYRQQRHEEMRARADEMGMEMPDLSPWSARQQAMDDEWAKHQQVIQGMSDEERAACRAMHRRHMGMMRGGRGGQGCGGMGHQGCGMYRDDYGPRMMPGYGADPGQGYQGYGYGPGYGPGPYGPGPQNFWDPNQ
jgi:hypothetical protein